MQYDGSMITSFAILCFGRYSEMVLFKSARAVLYMTTKRWTAIEFQLQDDYDHSPIIFYA